VVAVDGVEVLGYVASALVVTSLTMTSVVRLRSISLAGSFAFAAYGLLIESVPIIITNVCIAAINIWFLRAELGMHRDLGASQIAPDSPFLTDFIAFHLADIQNFQPGFEMPADDAFVLLLTRDGLPAGALVGRREDDELEVVLDYVTPPYRDSRLGNWLFGPGRTVFRSAGISRLVSSPGEAAHHGYLERMGFVRQGDGAGPRYVLDLT
jgi:hypothetical protein